MSREGNNPKRRVKPKGACQANEFQQLASRLVYQGSAIHKRSAGDYGFVPPASPRPHKSLCDDVRVILRAEARALFRDGILRGMISDYEIGDRPKYVWTVDEDNEVYEAKVDSGAYHGYRLKHDDDMRQMILKEWKRR
jgi:hypothetical protein